MRSLLSIKAALLSGLAALVLGSVVTAPPARGALGDRDVALAFSSPRNQSDETFSEQVMCRGALKGGGSLYARLTVGNAGPADGTADLRVRVSIPDGRGWAVSVRREEGEWKTDRRHLMADLGDARWTGRVGRFDVKASNAEVDIELNITTRMKPVRPAGGNPRFGSGDFYRTTILVPHGRVTGRVLVRPSTPGGASEEISVTGWVYMEHRAGNRLPFRMATRWHSVLDVRSSGTFAAAAWKARDAEGGGLRGWMFKTERSRMAIYEPEVNLRVMESKRDKRSGYDVPQVVHLSSRGDSGVSGVLQVKRLKERVDDLAKLGRLERFFVARFAKPVSFRHDVRYLLKVPSSGPASEPGQPDSGRKVKGRATYVFQQLN